MLLNEWTHGFTEAKENLLKNLHGNPGLYSCADVLLSEKGPYYFQLNFQVQEEEI